MNDDYKSRDSFFLSLHRRNGNAGSSEKSYCRAPSCGRSINELSPKHTEFMNVDGNSFISSQISIISHLEESGKPNGNPAVSVQTLLYIKIER